VSERARFYKERDRRTQEYSPAQEACFERPVTFCVASDAADSPRGQLTAAAALNMVVRIHRRVCLVCPDKPLLVPEALIPVQPAKHARLRDALVAMAAAIDPYITIDTAAPHEVDVGIAIGGDAAVAVPWYIGSEDGLVKLDTKPLRIDDKEGFSLGACLASCVAAASLFKLVVDRPVIPLCVSAWNMKEGADAEGGPSRFGPVDVGSVAMVGAGGVGGSLAYWLRQNGIRGEWRVIDGDCAELHNTNRSLDMVAADAGWPNLMPRPKAIVAAEQFGAVPQNLWFDQLDQEAFRPDLVLPLANERAVRNAVSQRGEPLLLHATTSPTWEAQLHRHIPDRDDCIMCRMPPSGGTVQLACSAVRVGGEGMPTDAALPFLSASAGFLVMNGLHRLMSGDLSRGDCNLWRLLYNSPRAFIRSAKCKCQTDCVGIPSRSIRSRVNAGRRWACLDSGS